MKDGPQYLKMERLRRGWTLQDASDRSRINITVLRALESGKTSELGSAVTVSALISKYSAALAMEDGQREARPLEAEKPAGGSRVLLHVMIGLAMGVVLTAVCLGIVLRPSFFSAKPPVGHHPIASAAKPAPPASAVSKVKQAATALRQPETPKAKKKPAVVPPAPAVSPPAAPPAAPKGAIPAQAAVPALHALRIAANQTTWIQVVIDGGKTESLLLQPGQTRQWMVEKRVNLIVGNGGGVNIMWDGKPVKISRTVGRVVRLKLSGS